MTSTQTQASRAGGGDKLTATDMLGPKNGRNNVVVEKQDGCVFWLTILIVLFLALVMAYFLFV